MSGPTGDGWTVVVHTGADPDGDGPALWCWPPGSGPGDEHAMKIFGPLAAEMAAEMDRAAVAHHHHMTRRLLDP